MAYRDRTTSHRSGFFAFCIMEVRLRKKGAGAAAKDDVRLLSVDTQFDTLQYVQDHMTQCVANIVRLKAPAPHAQQGVNESAALFLKKLEPLVSSLAAADEQGIMNKLSASLKKALLLLVMERYQSDREKACQILGISQEKLERELKLCGVVGLKS